MKLKCEYLDLKILLFLVLVLKLSLLRQTEKMGQNIGRAISLQVYKIAYCREKWSMLKYESEQCLEGTALSEGLRVVVVLRWQCPERLLCQCTHLGKLTRLLKDVGIDHLSEDSCLQIVHSKRVGL